MDEEKRNPKTLVFAVRTYAKREYDVAKGILNRILSARESIKKIVSSQVLDEIINDLNQVINEIKGIEFEERESVLERILRRRLQNLVLSLERIVEDLRGISTRFKSINEKIVAYSSERRIKISYDPIPGDIWEKIADEFRIVGSDLQTHTETLAVLIDNMKTLFESLATREIEEKLRNIVNRLSGFTKNVTSINYPKIYSILVHEDRPGYILVEAQSYTDVEKAVYGLRYAKLPRSQSTTAEEMMKVFKRKPKAEMIEVGAIVEITRGPLVGLKGRVTRVDPKKKEVTIEILDSNYPLPFTIKSYYIRVIDQKRTEEER